MALPEVVHGPNCDACRRVASQPILTFRGRGRPAGRERRCLACDEWFEGGARGDVFCAACAARLDAITAAVSALFAPR